MEIAGNYERTLRKIYLRVKKFANNRFNRMEKA